MLSSILFQDLGEKAGHEGYIQTPDDLNDYSLEEEKLVGGEVEEDAFEVKYIFLITCKKQTTLISQMMSYYSFSSFSLNRT